MQASFRSRRARAAFSSSGSSRARARPRRRVVMWKSPWRGRPSRAVHPPPRSVGGFLYGISPDSICFSLPFIKILGDWTGCCSGNTVCNGRMLPWKLRETKQEPSRARSENHISCCLFSLHFLYDILPSRMVVKWAL